MKIDTKKYAKNLLLTYIVVFLLNIGLTISIANYSQVEAAGFTNVALRHSRMAISIAASSTDPILVVFKPATSATELRLVIGFGAGYTVNGTASNITTSTTGLPSTYQGTSVTAANITGNAASAVSSQNVTFTLGTDPTTSNLYGFYITGGITNPSSTGSQTSRITTHSTATPDLVTFTDVVDNTRVATYFVTDNGASTDADQIVVTAKVTPTYTFSLSANAITLDTALATVEYPGGAQNGAVPVVTATVTTNANNGHALWLKSGTSAGLTSSTLSASIAFSGTAADANPTTLSAGTEGVVIDVDSNTNTSGSLTIDAEFNGGSTSAGGTPSTSFQQIASASGPAGSAGDKVDIIPRVAISATTQSADDYTQTFTVIGAGNF
ncbi:MAG: hypothetical protein U0525_03755 [Patescibacteria group bacterium]